jgi:hypothetical protein
MKNATHTLFSLFLLLHASYSSPYSLESSNHKQITQADKNNHPTQIKISPPKPIDNNAFALVSRNDFFKDVLGIDEQAWQNKDKTLFFSPDIHANAQCRGGYLLKNGSKTDLFKTGSFQEFTIQELREQTAKISKTHSGRFNVIAGFKTAPNSWFRYYVDIGALQAEDANKDAVFQVASNFSCLEPTSISHLPEQGITNYIHDQTQGPFASLSAAPGLIYRMYYIFYNPNTDSSTWRQTTNNQINLLDKVPISFAVTNGYLNLQKNNTVRPDDITAIKIGFHENIQVTHGFVVGNKHAKVTNPNQIVNQVFTAAIDFGNLNAHLRNNPKAIEKAKLILDAAYEGTLRAAALKGKKKVYLTLIGGGVFCNDLSWIAQAIEKNKNFIKESGLDVTLILYSFTEFSDFTNRMFALTKETNGIFTVYKQDGIYNLV